MSKEEERLVREMKAFGWSLEIKKGSWKLIDPKGDSINSTWPPFVKGFVYGFLRCHEDA